MRRTTLAITGALTKRDLGTVAGVTAAALGWDAERKNTEIDSTVKRLTDVNQMKL